jgi:dienelactone hydrolase
MGGRRLRYAVVTAALGAAFSMAGCRSGGPPKAGQTQTLSLGLSLTATPSARIAFDPVDIRVTGAAPGSTVTLSASATDLDKVPWTSAATFRADSSGVVDLAKQAPVSGSYGAVDEMGLLWSMNPPRGSKAWAFSGLFNASVTATDQGMRQTLLVPGPLMASGETQQALTVAGNGFEGHLYLPRPGAKPRPAVITLGGSEGGESTVRGAMALAAEGYPAMSVGYFGEPGTPKELKDIPLEYFAKAATWLAKQPGVDKAHILMMGGSRGSEAAMLTAQSFPSLVHGAIVYSPSASLYGSYPEQGGNAWTLHGAPIGAVTSLYPVDKIDGPVLAFAGDSDEVWQSASSANEIMSELDQAHDVYPHKATVYPNAGHFVDASPYMPALTTYTEHGVQGEAGGTRQGDAAAQGDSWRRVLALLAGLAGR